MLCLVGPVVIPERPGEPVVAAARGNGPAPLIVVGLLVRAAARR